MEGDVEFSNLMARVRDNVMVDQSMVEEIATQYDLRTIDQLEAIKRLRALDQGRGFGAFGVSMRQVDAEWVALLKAMSEESEAWQTIARQQYRQGYYLLPVSVVAVLFIAIAGTQLFDAPAAVVTPLAGAALAALAAHSFFVFRVHQQARLAAERLSEKRAAILFLRVAIGRSDPLQATQLLTAGTAMFLGHHAAAAVPLTSEDRGTK